MLCVLLGLLTSMQSIQNLGLAVIAILVGIIVDIRGYLVLEVFFCSCICSQLDSVCPQVFFFFFLTFRLLLSDIFVLFPALTSPHFVLQLRWWQWWGCTLWIFLKVVGAWSFLYPCISFNLFSVVHFLFSFSFSWHLFTFPHHFFLFSSFIQRAPPLIARLITFLCHDLSSCRWRFEPVSCSQSQTPEGDVYRCRVSILNPSSLPSIYLIFRLNVSSSVLLRFIRFPSQITRLFIDYQLFSSVQIFHLGPFIQN